ncbi:hypothetical protein BCR39DRAFT_524888 [Naematelia encephala]|uniref:C2H2-type domain-containing protein n=1 Tax=Naematelia encephala TaxID=71784 RepID=A0A1Y2BAW3_9TREE|nr:hypothetical protein BCR39DRAFT_524888 [Naematelia encephala]
MMEAERGGIFKRRRSLSQSSASSSNASSSSSRSSSPFLTPPPKFHRAGPSSQQTYEHECNLPPTCCPPQPSTSFATLDELERHQAAFHRWVCHIPIRDRGRDAAGHMDIPIGFVGRGGTRECAKVFPEERLLDLHYTEVHDPIALERKTKGQKIFACFLPPEQCDRKFLDPSKRRRHLIDKHGYPPTYFFAITNHGINRIAQEDGLAMSLVRPRRSQKRSSQPNALTDDKSFDPGPGPVVVAVAQMHQRSSDVAATHEMNVDDLSAKMDNMQTSLSFVPRGVRKKTVVTGMAL